MVILLILVGVVFFKTIKFRAFFLMTGLFYLTTITCKKLTPNSLPFQSVKLPKKKQFKQDVQLSLKFMTFNPKQPLLPSHKPLKWLR